MTSVQAWAQRGRQLSVRQRGAEGSVEQGSEVPLQLTGEVEVPCGALQGQHLRAALGSRPWANPDISASVSPPIGLVANVASGTSFLARQPLSTDPRDPLVSRPLLLPGPFHRHPSSWARREV